MYVIVIIIVLCN